MNIAASPMRMIFGSLLTFALGFTIGAIIFHNNGIQNQESVWDLGDWGKIQEITEKFNDFNCSPILEHLPPGSEAFYWKKSSDGKAEKIIYTWKISCMHGEVGFANSDSPPRVAYPQNMKPMGESPEKPK